MPKALRNYLVTRGLAQDATVSAAWKFYTQLDGQARVDARAALQGTRRAPRVPAPGIRKGHVAVLDPAADPREILRAERKRVRDIEALVSEDISQELVRQAIDEEWTPNEAGRAFLIAERQGRAASDVYDPGAPAVHTGRAPSIAVLATALAGKAPGRPLARCAGMFVDNNRNVGEEFRDEPVLDPDERKKAAERIADQATSVEGVSLLRMCEMGLRAIGRPTPSNQFDIVREAVSTGVLTNTMSPALNASLLDQFEAAPDTTAAFTTEVELQDFRKVERHQTGMTGQPNKRLRGQQADRGTFSDQLPEEYQAFEYAETNVLDRQDIINDRLDVIQRWPREMANAFARLRPDLVYYLLLSNPDMADGSSVFSSGRGNIGTASLSAASIEEAVKIMGAQVKGTGKEKVNLNLTLATLIVPQALRFSAQRELTSADRRGKSGDSGTKNVLADMDVGLAVDGRIDNGVRDPDSGASASGAPTKWFAAANPNANPVIEVGFVNGMGRAPEMNTRTLAGENGYWGIEWSISHAVAAKVLEWRTLFAGNHS